jgi:hypothetical protein
MSQLDGPERSLSLSGSLALDVGRLVDAIVAGVLAGLREHAGVLAGLREHDENRGGKPSTPITGGEHDSWPLGREHEENGP